MTVRHHEKNKHNGEVHQVEEISAINLLAKMV